MKRIIEPLFRPTAVLVVKTERRVFYASLEKNDSARAFSKALDPYIVSLERSGEEDLAIGDGFPSVIPWAETATAVKPGDILLCEGNRIAVSLTEGVKTAIRLACIGNADREELETVFAGRTRTEFYLEWSE